MIAGIGQLGKESQHRTTGIGHSRQVGLTGQLRQMSLDRTEKTGQPGHHSKDRTAASGELWTRLLGQGSWYRTPGVGQRRQDCRDKTNLAGQH
jgi:hypothetical protein